MAELHPNDIGLATFNDVGDVSALKTVEKVIVSAINEIYTGMVKNYVNSGSGIKHINASTTSLGASASALGQKCTASGDYSFSAGDNCSATAIGAFACGANTMASGIYSFASGRYSQSTSNYTHSEGFNCIAENTAAHAEGYYCQATGYCSHAGGVYTIARYCQTVIGRYNIRSISTDSDYNAVHEAFLIGNGISSSARANCFKVTYDGNCSANGTFTSPAGDYAEYFEWADGNSDNEDRAGRFVKLYNDKIVFAEDMGDVLGVISAVPAIIGDSAEFNWKRKYLTDDFGRIQYHNVTVPAEYNKDGELMREETVEYQPVINPDYDPTLPYVSRKERPEWDAVGVIGKLIVYDDGTCESGGLCRPTIGGGATKSTTKKGYRVMKRVSDDKILIWMR